MLEYFLAFLFSNEKLIASTQYAEPRMTHVVESSLADRNLNEIAKAIKITLSG